MRNFILTLSLLAIFFNSSQITAQTAPCATSALTDRLLTDFPETKVRLDAFNQSLKENGRNKNHNNSVLSIPAPGSITIPVVVYIVHDGTALTDISDAQVNDQLTALNNCFLSTGIKFCLATKVNTGPIPTVNATDVQNTAGIIHINNPTLSNHLSSSQSALVATSSPFITKDRYLRIWVVKSIDGLSSGTLGYSMYPNTSSVFDGVVMRYDVFGNGNPNLLANYNLGKVLVHEVGHYLFLYHTFEGSCSTYFNDCLLDGDHVCDTPSVATPNFNCVSGTNSCVETPAVYDDLSNYMDYGNNLCQSHFTNGQIERMLNVLNLSRSSLIATENIIYTGTCGSTSLLSATITPNDFSPCASSTVATTFNAATSAATYSWNFGDAFATGSNPNTSSSSSASHIYTSAANSPYTVTLTVTSGGESRTSSELIFVTDCQPIHNYNSYWYVERGSGLNFSSGKPVFDPTFPLANSTTVFCNNQNDSTGNLLFYSNKFKVWNNQHQQINTTDLMANTCCSDSYQMLSLPKPPATGNIITQYYIFTQQVFNSGATDLGFRYAIVNVTGTLATMGAIGQPITLPSSYGFDQASDGALIGGISIAAVKKCNDHDYWILTTLKKGNTPYLVVFSLTSNGLEYTSERLLTGTNALGTLFVPMMISPNGNKILLTSRPSFIYDFDKVNGIVSNNFTEISIPTTPTTYGQVAGAVFSPDSNLLYLCDVYAKKIYQFNINSINILNSRKEIASTINGPQNMQMGPDNKIYVGMEQSIGGYQKLSVIHNPNILATTEAPNACHFTLNGPKPTNFVYRIGPCLPNIVNATQETAYFSPNTLNVICKYITACNTYKFFPNVCGTSFAWTFTNTSLGTSSTTTVTDPTYNFSQNGTYIVTLRDSSNNLLGTSQPIVISSSPTAVIDGSTTACLTRVAANITNNSTILNAGETATWSITGGVGTITAQNNLASVNINWTVLPGIITLTKVDASGCTSVTTKTITAFCPMLGNQQHILEGLSISPNPSHGVFTIHTQNALGKITVTVCDMRGRIVLAQRNFDFNGSEKTIDLSSCQSGMYVLKLAGSDFNYSHKLIKN